MKLKELYQIIEKRKQEKSIKSYIASLFKDGKDRIIQKFGEESIEVVIASKNKSRKRVISEVADLLFHLLILLSSFNIDLSEIFEELEKKRK